MLDDEPGQGSGFYQSRVHQAAQGNAFPLGVELAPARHAVNVHHQLRTRQRHELVIGQAQRLFHLTPHSKVPGQRVKARHRTVMQHGELLGQSLTGRKPACLFHFILIGFTRKEIFHFYISLPALYPKGREENRDFYYLYKQYRI